MSSQPRALEGIRGALLDVDGTLLSGALVVGKPSSDFFALCLADLGLPPGEVVVVGDDPVSDGVGGASVGCRTVLVQTGKWSKEGMRRSGALPRFLIPSIAALT